MHVQKYALKYPQSVVNVCLVLFHDCTSMTTEFLRQIRWMFGGSRRDIAAQIHRELRVLHRHYRSELQGSQSSRSDDKFGVNAIGIQSPVCWPDSPPHLRSFTHTTTDFGGSRGWNGWSGRWPGGWGGSTLSGVALFSVNQFDNQATENAPPAFQLMRPAPVADVVAVMLKGEWPKLSLDVASIEQDLHDIILDPDPYNTSQNFQRSVLLGKISLPLTLHTPMDAHWLLTFVAVSELASFRVLAAKAWPENVRYCGVLVLFVFIGSTAAMSTNPV